MERWQNKVAVVTGASSGIGETIARELVKAGLVVVALARRENRLQENQKALPVHLQSRYHPLKCDVTSEGDVKRVFDWIEKELGGTDILINNAGVIRLGVALTDPDNSQAMHDVIDTNVMAAMFCIREAFNSMKRRKVDGHVVIVNSVVGHMVPNFPGMNIYPASKFAVTAMAETYRQEFINAGTKVKVTSISPGAVDTEAIPDGMRNTVPFLKTDDISDAVQYVLATPPHVQVHELIINPIGAALPPIDKKE